MVKKQPVPLTGRDKLLSDLVTLHSGMRPTITASGVQEGHYDSVLRGIEEKTNEEIEGLMEWLESFNGGPVKDVLAIYNLKSEDWWINMTLIFRQSKTREHKLLKQARTKLRKAWYKRHGEPIDNGQSEESVQNEDRSDPS